MKFKSKIWTVVTIFSLMGLVGCASKPEAATDNSTGIVKESPTQQTVPNAKISTATAELIAAEKNIENVKSIELVNIDGKKLDKTFSQDEINTIVTAYNESSIQDTAYIMMLAGSTMLITLEDGSSVTITSYGDENNIVATSSNGATYHLGCPTIAKILLAKAE